MTEAWTVLGTLFWVLLGAAITLAAVIIRGRRLWKRGGDIEFGRWLGRECDVLRKGRWRRCTVVAVSHKGAIAVRNTGDGSGMHAKWVPKDEVPERVRWL